MANTLTIGFGGIDQSSTIKLKSFAVLFYIYLRPFHDLFAIESYVVVNSFDQSLTHKVLIKIER